MQTKDTVVISLLGTQLDAGKGDERWRRWRPNVSVCQHDDLLVSRMVLLAPPSHSRLTRTIARDIGLVSPETKVQIEALDLANPWDFEQVYSALRDFTEKMRIDVETEEYLVHITTGTHVEQICLFLLTESRLIPGKLLQSSPPARDAQADPAGQYHVIDLDLSRYDSIASRFAREHQRGVAFLKAGIDTRSAGFNRLIERIEFVALRSSAPILLMGPTGAGKSKLARRIFELKQVNRQIEGLFVEVNCATLRGDAAMSTLFGHTRGAFTGALKDRPGLLRAADKGMIFLDEIGDLGSDEQAMLLRALEEKRFLPVGADKEVTSNFLLIAGTNRDLGEAVAGGGFREDLLARINLWSFNLPALAERSEDIEPNVDHELQEYTRRSNQRVTFNAEARQLFLAWASSPAASWRANFRDLNAAITRLATLASGGRITEDLVREEITHLEESWRKGAGDAPRSLLPKILSAEEFATIDPFDLYQLEGVVGVCRDAASISDAGRRLYSVSRLRKKHMNDADRLRKYLKRFSLSWERIKAAF